MSIQINTDFANSALPVMKSLATQIEGYASFKGWFQGDAARVVQSGSRISQVNSRGASSAKLVQATGSKQPLLVDAQINGYSVARHDRTRPDWLQFSALGLDMSLPFSILMVYRPTLISATDIAHLASFNSTSVMTHLHQLADGTVSYQLGSSSIAGLFTANSAYHCVLIGRDATLMKARADGTRKSDVTIVGSPGTAAFYIGAFDGATGSRMATMDWADIIVLQEDIFDPAAAARLQNLVEYCSNVYGLTL